MNQPHGIQFILNKGKNPLHYSNKAEKYMPQITSVADLLEKKKVHMQLLSLLLTVELSGIKDCLEIRSKLCISNLLSSLQFNMMS